MKKHWLSYLWILLPLAGVLAGWWLMNREVNLIVDGKAEQIHTRALTVRGALSSAGYELSEGDVVEPAANTWLGSGTEIRYTRAGSIFLWVDPKGTLLPVNTTDRTAKGILAQAGFTPRSGDSFKVNGREVEMNQPLPENGRLVLQYTPALALTVNFNGEDRQVITSAGWLGKALWENEIQIKGANLLNEPFDSLLVNPVQVEITPIRRAVIQADGREFSLEVPEGTVGQALLAAGIPLQDLDYSIPADSDPLPEDGAIKVVRVREEVIREQSTIAFDVQQTSDADLPLGEVQVVTPGVLGVQQVTVRVRYEDGKEVSRVTEDAVVLKEPVAQVEKVGSKFVIQTLDTPSGTISYYRTVTAWATSYAPCKSGGSRCYYGTSSGLPVQKGVIGVTLEWYRLLKGTQVYIPGYGIGTIADVGGGVPGKYWVDLGYSDSDWEQWSQNVTVYFLTPIPANAPAVLP